MVGLCKLVVEALVACTQEAVGSNPVQQVWSGMAVGSSLAEGVVGILELAEEACMLE